MRRLPLIDTFAEKLLEAGQHHVSIATGPSIPDQVKGEYRDLGGTNGERPPVSSEVDRLNAHTLEELDELVLCRHKEGCNTIAFQIVVKRSPVQDQGSPRTLTM